MKFKKQLGFWDLVVYGIGVIIGAGIYVLIAPATSLMGNGIWISFLFATIIVTFTGLSYAYLSSKYSFEAAEYFLVRRFTNSKFLSFLVAWLVITAQIIAIAAVSIGFSQYLSSFLKVNILVSSLILIFFVTVVNLFGVKEVSRLNFLLTSLAVVGLLTVVVAGFRNFGKVNYFEIGGVTPLLKSTALIFFSFIGFESIVNLGAEVKRPSKTIPKALVASIAFSGLLYVLVAISSVSVIDWKLLSQSNAPLSFVASSALGPVGYWIVEIAALFSTASTVLILSVVTPRMMWGLASEGLLPRKLSFVKNSVPVFSTLISSIIASAFVLLLKEVSVIAEIANFNMLIVYAIFNFITFKVSKEKKIKLVSFFGMLSIGLIFVYLSKTSFLAGSANLLIGLLFYKLFNEAK